MATMLVTSPSPAQQRSFGAECAAARRNVVAAMPLMSVHEVSIRFGGIAALDAVSFDIAHGVVVGLIGPNGAGKTTLFNCLTRLYTPHVGDIRIEGRSILHSGPHLLARLGVARTFQNLALFRGLSVLDNVRVGAHTRVRGNWLADALRLPQARRGERAIDAIVWPLLERLDLARHAMRRVGELPFGLQKRVEIARALAARPRLLLLDEPAGGLNHGDVHELGQLLLGLREELGLAILLVEHHMGLVFSVAQRVVVLSFGRKIADGTPAQIRAHPEVVAAYLGGTGAVP